MNRFVIVDGLPYLLAGGKTYAVRWDEKGFTVGTEVELASVPEWTYNELSIKAKCAGNLDSITPATADEADESQADEPQEDAADEAEAEEEQEAAEGFNAMTVSELKAYAAEHDIALGSARTKAEIINRIADALI